MVKCSDKNKKTLKDVNIPLDLCENSVCATSKQHIDGTGLLKIAPLDERYLRLALKMQKKKLRTGFFCDVIHVVPHLNLLNPEDLGEIFKA